MLLYGGPAAIFVSALEGVAATLIISKRPRTVLFNSAILATSTFFTATILQWTVGPPVDIIAKDFSNTFFLAICIMALVQYVANTGLIAVEKAYKMREMHISKPIVVNQLITMVAKLAHREVCGFALPQK